MPVAWFVTTYKRRDRPWGQVGRYCAMDDYTVLIDADGGTWREVEILGQRAIVKVRASAATLQTINADPGIRGVPASMLDDPLSSLTNAQRNALRQLALDCGYTASDFTGAFPDGLGSVTLGQFLRFLARRRRKVRYDRPTDQILDDGPDQPTGSVDDVDADVT